MAKFTTIKYTFVRPEVISESLYNELRYKLQNDYTFSLIDPKDTITNEFSGFFKFIYIALVCLPIGLILALLEVENGVLMTIGIICLLLPFFAFVSLVLNSPTLSSYAGYLRKKRAYFSKMEECIKKSTSYFDFLVKFYQSND